MPPRYASQPAARSSFAPVQRIRQARGTPRPDALRKTHQAPVAQDHLDDQRRRGLGYYRWRRQRDLVCDLNRRKTRLRARRNRQASRPSLFAPAMQLIGMHLVPTRDLRNTRARRKTLFNKPQLLRGRPSPPTLPANQNRTRRHACSLICQLLSKLPTHDSAPPGRDWSDAYCRGREAINEQEYKATE